MPSILSRNLVPRAFSSFKMAVGETPGRGCLKQLQKFLRISSRKRDELTSFRLNNGFRLQKTNRAARRWKQPPKKPLHHVSRDKILHDSWSISAALARGFSDRHFERGEGPGDEVVLSRCRFSISKRGYQSRAPTAIKRVLRPPFRIASIRT